jgi:hypothetical protein
MGTILSLKNDLGNKLDSKDDKISTIVDVYVKERTVKLSNKEKIQFMGYINNNPYYLFCNDQIIFYLKIKLDEGFGICYDQAELESDFVYTYTPNKIPNSRKISITISQMDNPNNYSIYNLEGGLKIGHISSNYSKMIDTGNSVECSEYLLNFNNKISILSYHHLKGYSIINKSCH